MARQLVILALVFAAVIGLASAAGTAFAPMASSAEASSPEADNTVGALDESGSSGGSSDEAVEAPVGGPVPAGTFPPTVDAPPPAPNGSSGAAAIGGSALVAMGAIAVYFF